MKNFDISVTVTVIAADQLDPDRRALFDKAREATYRSYAPYSHFSVGAVIELASHTTIAGSNQENAAYPSSLCAERTAAYYAHSSRPEDPFRRIAIAARGTDGHFTGAPISPCGACRQALLEYEKLAGQDVEVMLCGAEEVYIFPSVKSLLPYCFTDF